MRSIGVAKRERPRQATACRDSVPMGGRETRIWWRETRPRRLITLEVGDEAKKEVGRCFYDVFFFSVVGRWVCA